MWPFNTHARLKPLPQYPHLKGRVCIRTWTLRSEGRSKAFPQTVQLYLLGKYSAAEAKLASLHSWMVRAFFTVRGLSLIGTKKE